ncbi:hypothetical protein BC833DRAFT_598554 [Globomyces pollinis-pini]|nr:hypothetical protein BC833DRAFT_598554 [Globomyces pollinis-pini]
MIKILLIANNVLAILSPNQFVNYTTSTLGPSFCPYTWKGYLSTPGDSKLTAIAAATKPDGVAYLAGISSPDGKLIIKNQTLDDQWGVWMSTGIFAQSLSIASSSSGSVEIVGVGSMTNNSISSSFYHCTLVQKTWSCTVLDGTGSEAVGGYRVGGDLTVFMVDNTNSVSYRTRSNAVWSNWVRIETSKNIKNLALVNDQKGYLQVFGVGIDNNVYHTNEYDLFKQFKSFDSVDMNIATVYAGLHSDGTINVLALSRDNQIQLRSQWNPNGAGIGWTPWRTYNFWNDNISPTQLVVGNTNNGNMAIFGVGTDKVLRYTWGSINGAFAGWTKFLKPMNIPLSADPQLAIIGRRNANISLLAIGDGSYVYELKGRYTTTITPGPDYPPTYCWNDYSNSIVCGTQT